MTEIQETDTSYAKVKVGTVKKIYTCSLGKTKVKLSWDPVEGADGYFLYRKESSSKKYKQLAEVRKCSYTDKKIEYDKDYTYRIVPVSYNNSENQDQYVIECVFGKETTQTFSNKKIVATDHQKYTYAEMKKDISLLADKYYGLVRADKIGKSEDGRILYDVVIGNPNAKKTLLVVSALHAREYMTSQLSMAQIEYYLEEYNNKINGTKVSDVLNEICIHYVPMANPDGVTLSQSGISKIKDPTLQAELKKIAGKNTATWKANARGVNLNRNFPYDFIVRGKAGGIDYSGPSANSESETQAVSALIDKLKKGTKLKGVINYHSTGSIIFGDYYGSKKSSVGQDTQKMYQLARTVTGYSGVGGITNKKPEDSNGNLREYLMLNLKIPSITIEIGRKPCPLSISEFPDIWRRNKDLVIREAMLFY